MGYPMDPRAVSLLGRSHGAEGQLVASTAGSEFVEPLALLPGGTVQLDAKSPVRRKLSCEVAVPVDSPLVDPFSAEVKAAHVLIDSTSARRYVVPCGVFVVTEAKETAPGVVSLSGEDRWRRVQDARFEVPQVTSGSTRDAIEQLLVDADYRIEVDLSRAPSGTHRSSVWERDRDKAILELAQSIGARVYFNADGVAVVEPISGVLADPYWTVGTGPGGVRLRAARGLGRGNTYNVAVVTGESTTDVPPVYGVARDNDPRSRTRWGGPFGKRPRFYTSSLVTTQAQAQAVAAGMLAGVTGIVETHDLESLPHPGLEGFDVLEVELGEAGSGRYVRELVQTATIPLGIGAMSLTTGSDTAVDDEEEGQ